MNSSSRLWSPRGLILRDGIRVDGMDLLGAVVDIADEQLDPLQGLVSGLAHVFMLLLCQRIFPGLGKCRRHRQHHPNARDGYGSLQDFIS